MFGNFIYLIIALLIYTTYYPPDQPNFLETEVALLTLFLIVVFAAFTWFQFRRIEKRIGRESFIHVDNRFSSAMTRHAILAVGFFACSIYGLNLTTLTARIPFVRAFQPLKP